MMKVLILGHRYSGKSTAAQIVAGLIGSGYMDTSLAIMKEFAEAKSVFVDELIKNKEAYRDDLFNFAREIQEKDPGYFVRTALDKSNVVSGARNKDEIQDTRSLFDLILWIDRDVAEKGSTEMVGPEDADIIIDNNGNMAWLKYQIEEILSDYD